MEQDPGLPPMHGRPPWPPVIGLREGGNGNVVEVQGERKRTAPGTNERKPYHPPVSNTDPIYLLV